MNKVIFVDIDGVLNSFSSVDYHHRTKKKCNPWKHLDPMCLEQLRNIIEKVPDVQFVISSSWRHGCTPDIKQRILKAFQEYKFSLPLHDDWHTIQHWSISKDYLTDPKPENYTLDWRGNEVAEWLSRHPEVTMHICLDDDSDFLPSNNLVQTETHVGLTHNEAQIVIAYFTQDILKAIECDSMITKYIPRRLKHNLDMVNKIKGVISDV